MFAPSNIFVKSLLAGSSFSLREAGRAPRYTSAWIWKFFTNLWLLYDFQDYSFIPEVVRRSFSKLCRPMCDCINCIEILLAKRFTKSRCGPNKLTRFKDLPVMSFRLGMSLGLCQVVYVNSRRKLSKDCWGGLEQKIDYVQVTNQG